MMQFDIESLKFDNNGLIPAIAQDYRSGEVLMMAWMNRASVEATLTTRQVTYWSRSRSELWRKGATSGNVQRLIRAHADCDRDCLLLQVEQSGPACHTGRRSCFFVRIDDRNDHDGEGANGT